MTTPRTTPIRVMLVDDHPMVRIGLSTIIKVFEDIEMVAEAENGRQAVERCAEILPDVILMDLKMPVMDGVNATIAIRDRFPHVQVLALTSFMEGKLIDSVFKAGAIGYLLKNSSADEIAWAIRSAAAGRARMSTDVAQALVEAANQRGIPDNDLTARELEVLALMVEGLNNTQIATQLTVSPSTIKSHVSNILAKLGANSRTEAVTLALRNQLLK